MVYVTHDQVEAMTMADRIVVLDGGKVEQVGSPLELYHRPDTLFVAGFIGSPRMNLIAGPVAAQHGAATIGIRPEHVRLGVDGHEGRALLAEHLGSDTFLHVDAGPLGRVVVRAPGESAVAPGDVVRFAFDPARLHRFDEAGRAVRS
jgi:multiple sugar transport system ATP-binding protein